VFDKSRPRECPTDQEEAQFDCCQVKESQDEHSQKEKPQGHCFQWKAGWLEVLGGEVPRQGKERVSERYFWEKRLSPRTIKIFTSPSRTRRTRVRSTKRMNSHSKNWSSRLIQMAEMAALPSSWSAAARTTITRMAMQLMCGSN